MSYVKDTYDDLLVKEFSDADIQPAGMRISYNDKGQVMSLAIPELSGESFKLLAAGSYMARCIRVVDLGTQTFEYNGDVKTPHKIMLVFELPTEEIQTKEGDMKPMLLSKEYTLSMHEKATLRKDLESWRGKNFTDEQAAAFELKSLVGVACALTVIHKQSKGRTYANIGTINPLMKGTTCPEQVHDGFFYEIESKQNEQYFELPEWIQKKIDSAQENMKSEYDQSVSDETYAEMEKSNDLPF